MAPPGRRALPRALPEGFILTDGEKKRWRLGRMIGQGGCGLIYLASRDVDRPVTSDTEFVIKVEYQRNGPLFSELKFYQRAAKPDSMENWKRSRKLDFLGIPTYWGSGLAECNDLRYRFMAMDRLGCDLQKVCERNGGRLKKATILQLGRGLLDVLEYIHENEYVHADIKAANLMLGCKDPEQVYLADYGLSYRYCPDGVHKEYKENPKKGHNGTIEYTSLDAHKGLAPSRRGDLQILGFCLLHWLCGSLPWDKVLKNPTQVQEAKDRLMKNLPDSVQQLSVSGASTDEVATFLRYVKTLDYKDKPNYQHLKHLLTNDVTGRLDLSKPKGPAEDSIPAVREPPAREKRAGQASRASQARASEVDDEEGAKSKPVAARYTRGPALPKQLDGVPPAVSRSLRHRPVVSYREDDSESEEEDDVEARPKPILACYLRGPPIGPRAHSKQKQHGATWSSRETRERREQPLHSRRTNIQTSIKDRTHVDYRDRTGDPDGFDCSSPQQGLHRRRFPSPLSGPEQEAGPTQTHGLISWLVFVGVFLILVLLFF